MLLSLFDLKEKAMKVIRILNNINPMIHGYVYMKNFDWDIACLFIMTPRLGNQIKLSQLCIKFHLP